MNLDRLESDHELAIQSYLLQIVKNCLVGKAARTPQAMRQHCGLEAIAELADPTATAQQERAVQIRELAIAMDSLNEKDSEIIWLRDGLGMSHREVADQVGISEQASRQAYVRAKRTLLQGLASDLWPESHVGGPHATPQLS